MQFILHSTLTFPTWTKGTPVRMLFIDYSSAFNTIVTSKLITKLRTLGRNTSLCNWILDFVTVLPQTSATLVIDCSPC